MPYRNIPFVNGEVYHVFNRSIARQPIFNIRRDYSRFMNLIDYYRFGRLPLRFSHYDHLPIEKKEKYEKLHFVDENKSIQFLAYCIMPNHFHFLIKQISDNSISDFMRNVQNGFSKFFNLRYNRTGSLFQFMFKAVHIETDEQLIHVSRYIHLNPTTSHIIATAKLIDYPWSSLASYLFEDKTDSIVDTKLVLSNFGSRGKYKDFVYDQVDYQRVLNEIKHLIIE